MDFVAATVEGNLLLPWHLDGQVATVRAAQSPSAEAPQRFRPIDEEIRELERQRMAQALTAAQGVQSRAAELIAMPVRTFSHKLKQYQLGSQKKASDSE
jgi:DNA-binding NtrC family response regulator